MQKKPILRFHSKWVCDMCVIHLIFIHLKCDTESLADGRAVVRGFYNEQNNMVNSIYYDTSCVINMNCRKWESGLRTICNSQGKMDAMAIEEWWSM